MLSEVHVWHDVYSSHDPQWCVSIVNHCGARERCLFASPDYLDALRRGIREGKRRFLPVYVQDRLGKIQPVK